MKYSNKGSIPPVVGLSELASVFRLSLACWGSAVFTAGDWISTKPFWLPRRSRDKTMSASNEQATTRGRNHAGRLVFFRGPKGFGVVFFFFVVFLGAVAG